MDRISIRKRPSGYPVMHQKWGKLLFIHWRVPFPTVRSLVPDSLSIDLHEGAAWIGVVPFTMWDVHPSLTPALPGLSAFHELNVRTYVHRDGVPGVYFLSLDASLPLAVWAARRFYHLPYYTARIQLRESAGEIDYHSRRVHKGALPAGFRARWQPTSPLPPTEPGSLEFFLTERYCLYTEHRGRLYRCRIHHPPWPLNDVRLDELDTDLLASHGIPEPDEPPLLHAVNAIAVDIWPLSPVEAFSRTRSMLRRITPDTGPEPGRRPI